MCKVCNKSFKNDNSLAKHLRLIHNISLIEYLIKYENFIIPKCPYCKNDRKLRNGRKYNITCSDKKCIKENRENIKIDSKLRKKISESMKKAHLEGRHPGWHHINGNKDRRSVPEKIFYDFLLKNGFFDKYEIEEKLPYKGYYLDFAFIDKKIDVEIDGEQHYREEAILHDKKRDKCLNINDWVVYRISWYEMRKNIKKELRLFCDFLKEEKTENRLYDRNIVIEKKEYFCSCSSKKDRKSKMCKSCNDMKQRKHERPSYDVLIKNINELGYTGTGKKYGVSDNSIRKWKNYYEKKN